MSFRLKSILSVLFFVFVCIFFLENSRLEGFVLYGTIFFMVIMNYFINYWLFDFDLHPKGFLTILLLPAFHLGVYLLIYYNLLKEFSFLYRLLFTLAFILAQYYIVLTQNILNLSHFKNIGLSKAALTVNHFYTVVIFFLAVLAFFLVGELSLVVKLLLTVPVFILLYIIFALINELDNGRIVYTVLLYVFVILILCLLFMSGLIKPYNQILVAMILGILFHNFSVISLYSFRKVVSLPDFFMTILEAILVGALLYFSSF
ncbi:MAG: hypothetical protein KatS3mg084_0225 [Candidatus Dojkabacteria bacterium]|nr:MAG: hypothetical protein KatS3mg084_0225 [Candidatus Dojkabacteria bacterium]